MVLDQQNSKPYDYLDIHNLKKPRYLRESSFNMTRGDEDIEGGSKKF